MKATDVVVLNQWREPVTVRGFLVPGTHGTLAVTEEIWRRESYVLTHVPSGGGIFVNEAMEGKWSRTKAMRAAKVFRNACPLPVFEKDATKASKCLKSQTKSIKTLRRRVVAA